MNPSAPPPILELTRVSSGYGPIEALKGISLRVLQGEIVTLIGSNGAGKSTLLMTIFGSPQARSGEISFQGREITSLAPHQVAQLGISQVPEGRRLFPGMSVEENLVLGTVPTGGKGDLEMLANVYRLFPLLEERRRQRAGTLSGGEQQMLAIGRGMMSRPRLLLLDEPSLGLAPLMVKQIFHTLQAIARGGTTIFLVEQNANQALKLANRGYVMVNGRITLEGSGEELLNHPEVRQAYLGGH